MLYGDLGDRSTLGFMPRPGFWQGSCFPSRGPPCKSEMHLFGAEDAFTILSVLSLLGLPVLGHQYPVPERLRARRRTGLAGPSWVSESQQFQTCRILLQGILGG